MNNLTQWLHPVLANILPHSCYNPSIVFFQEVEAQIALHFCHVYTQQRALSEALLTASSVGRVRENKVFSKQDTRTSRCNNVPGTDNRHCLRMKTTTHEDRAE